MEELVSNEHPNDHKLTHGTVHARLLVCLRFHQGTATGHCYTLTKFLEQVKELEEGISEGKSQREREREKVHTTSTKAKRRMTPHTVKESLNITQ